MSCCTFLASDRPLPRIERQKQEDLGLLPLLVVPRPCELTCAAEVEAELTLDTAEQLLAQIRAALGQSESVELWRVWLMDFWEFEERPYLHTSVRRYGELMLEELLAVAKAEVWNKPDKAYPDRPSFYRLIITR